MGRQASEAVPLVYGKVNFYLGLPPEKTVQAVRQALRRMDRGQQLSLGQTLNQLDAAWLTDDKDAGRMAAKSLSDLVGYPIQNDLFNSSVKDHALKHIRRRPGTGIGHESRFD
jgi:hypothetical protein